MNTLKTLGRLEKVPLRDVWPNEPEYFTRWLAEPANLSSLGEALGCELEPESREKKVGPFSADILARDADTQNWVLIENQIAPTDHTHLGQLLTYAAGLDARTIVWVAERFREEHRAAIDFLNDATTEDYSLFAVEIELYRIGDSGPAPRFSVVAKPNGWNKQIQSVKRGGELSSSQQLNIEYWTLLINAANERHIPIAARGPSRDNFLRVKDLKVGNPQLILWAGSPFGANLRLTVFVEGSLARPAFCALQAHRNAIDSQFQPPLQPPLKWEPRRKTCIIAADMPGSERRENRDRWREQHEWLLETAPKLATTLDPFVNGLDALQLQEVTPDDSPYGLPS